MDNKNEITLKGFTDDLRVKSLLGTLQVFDDELCKIRSERRELKLSLDKYQKEVKNITSDLNTSKSEVTRLTSDLNTSKSEVTRLTSDLNTSKSEVTRLTSDLNTSKSEVTRLTSDLNTSKSEVTRLTSDLNTSKSEVTRLTTDFDTLSSKIEGTVIAEIKKIASFIERDKEQCSNESLKKYLNSILIKEGDSNNKGLLQIDKLDKLLSTIDLSESSLSQLCNLAWWLKIEEIRDEIMDGVADVFEIVISLNIIIATLKYKEIEIKVPSVGASKSLKFYETNNKENRSFSKIFSHQIENYSLCEISRIAYNETKGECYYYYKD